MIVTISFGFADYRLETGAEVTLLFKLPGPSALLLLLLPLPLPPPPPPLIHSVPQTPPNGKSWNKPQRGPAAPPAPRSDHVIYRSSESPVSSRRKFGAKTFRHPSATHMLLANIVARASLLLPPAFFDCMPAQRTRPRASTSCRRIVNANFGLLGHLTGRGGAM